MKSLHIKYFYLLFAAVLPVMVSSCDNEHEPEGINDELLPVRLNLTIEGNTVSRARDGNWATSDAIGLTITSEDGEQVLMCNKKFIYVSNTWDFSNLFYPNRYIKYSFISYYPYRGTEGTEPEPYSFTTSSDQQTAAQQPYFDFLWAEACEQPTGEPINLAHSHRMSKIVFNFKSATNGSFSTGNIKSYEVGPFKLDGTFDPVTGDCKANEDAEAKNLKVILTGGVQNNTILLFPQELSENMTLTITDKEDQQYSCKLNFESANYKLESGKAWQFNIEVSKLAINANVSITDWDYVDGGDGEAWSVE